MKFSVLASGSKANSTFISSGETSILVDCGLSAKQTFLRLRSRGLCEGDLDAILISHEHDDHIRGVNALANYTGLPVYLTEETYQSSTILKKLPITQVRFIDPYCSFSIKKLEIFPFSVSHDAADPICFKISDGVKSIGILSDLGVFSEREISYMNGVDALLLEANHDLEKLWKTHYPWSVKERIAGSRGHLSNECASRFIYEFQDQLIKVPKVILATHISDNSNSLELAKSALSSTWKKNNVPLFESTLQSEASELFSL